MAYTKEPNYYEYLGVNQDASTDEIKRAYRKLMKISHPDAGATTGSSQYLQLIYETLSDDEGRAEYDAEILDGGRKAPRDEPRRPDAGSAQNLGVTTIGVPGETLSERYGAVLDEQIGDPVPTVADRMFGGPKPRSRIVMSFLRVAWIGVPLALLVGTWIVLVDRYRSDQRLSWAKLVQRAMEGDTPAVASLTSWPTLLFAFSAAAGGLWYLRIKKDDDLRRARRSVEAQDIFAKQYGQEVAAQNERHLFAQRALSSPFARDVRSRLPAQVTLLADRATCVRRLATIWPTIPGEVFVLGGVDGVDTVLICRAGVFVVGSWHNDIRLSLVGNQLEFPPVSPLPDLLTEAERLGPDTSVLAVPIGGSLAPSPMRLNSDTHQVLLVREHDVADALSVREFSDSDVRAFARRLLV